MSAPDERPGIAPALTPEEWAALRPMVEHSIGEDGELVTKTTHFTSRLRDDFGDQMHTDTALAHAALPDGDRRKFTWAMVDEIRATVIAMQQPPCRGNADQWLALALAADALAALLPPRAP